MTRPTWDEYFLTIAHAVATRSDCERSQVGAVVVNERRIRATGYNGAPSGMAGCGSCPRRSSDAIHGETGYDRGPGRCVAVHAEANALLYCDRADLVGATLYITREPCEGCRKLIDATGVTRVVWPTAEYGDANTSPPLPAWGNPPGQTHTLSSLFSGRRWLQ